MVTFADDMNSPRYSPHLGIDRLGKHPPVLGDVLHHLLQRGSLHLLPFQVGDGGRNKVEEDAALSDLLDQKLLALALTCLLQLGQLHQLPVLTDIEPGREKILETRIPQIADVRGDIAFFGPARTLPSFLLYVAGSSIP